MKEVTDPALLNTLEGKEVTDPNVLAQLEGGQTPAEPSAGGFFDTLRRYKDSRVNDTSLSPGEKTVREIIWGLVPETPGQALATGIMAAAGPASLPLKAAGRAAPAIARTLAGAGAGAAGAAVDNGDVGQGALVGGGVTGAVESALPIGSKLLRSLPWMKGAIARMDAKRIGNTIGEISPEMAGRTTATELQNLGRVYTQDLPGGGGKQALRGLFQDLELQIGTAPVNIPSLGGKVTVADALKEISALGPRGYGGQNANVMTRIATGMDARAIRETLLDELRGEIRNLGAPMSTIGTPNRGLALGTGSGSSVPGPSGRYVASPENPLSPGSPSGIRDRTSYGPETYDIPRGGQEVTVGPHNISRAVERDVRGVSNPTQQTRRSNEIPTALEQSFRRAESLPPPQVPSQPAVTAQPGVRRVAIIDNKTGRIVGYSTESAEGIIPNIERGGAPSPPISRHAVGPTYLEQYDAAREAYSKGNALLKMLSSGRGYREFPAAQPQLHTPELQRYISDNRGILLQRLGKDDFAKLVDAVTRGGGLGRRDVLVPGGGGVADAAQSWLRGQNTGATQALRVPIATALPNLGSQYAGRAPFSAPDQLKILLDVLGISATSGGTP